MVIKRFNQNILFSQAFNNAAIGMALISIDGLFLEVNQSLIQILGYGKEEFLSLTFQEITHPEDIDHDRSVVGKLLRGETNSVHFEKRYIHKDGSVVWVLLSVSLIREDEATPAFYIAQIQDITARKRSEWELQNKITELHDLNMALDASAIVTIADAKGIITYVNEKFCEISKYSKEEVIGKSYAFLKSGDYPTSFYKYMWETIASGEIWKGEIKNRAKDYTMYWMDSIIVPFKNPSGQIYQFVSINIDITARKLAEKFLVESKAQLEIASTELYTLIENLPFGVVLEDDDCEIRLVNQEICKLFGLEQSPEELVGARCDLLIQQVKKIFGETDNFISRIQELTRKREIVHNEELELLDGRTFERDHIPIFVQNKYIGSLWNYRNVTERKITERQIRDANKQLELMSKLDGLTGIPNRRSFDDSLAREWRNSEELQIPLTLIMMDIDYFKKYNDTYGHNGGDICLKKVATAIHDLCVVRNGFAARYGGEEFAVILSNYTASQVEVFVETLFVKMEELAIPHKSSEISNVVTLSAGVASIIPEATIVIDDLIEMADQALYKAKANGRNQFCVFNPEEMNVK